jgi:flagellar biosynthesis/type III secretory pathway protein FliH
LLPLPLSTLAAADASDRLTPEEKAALAAEVESLKPALAAWREKNAPKLQAHYTRALAAAKEEALARGESPDAL